MTAAYHASPSSLNPTHKGVDSAVPALLIQQRHILGMMGLDIWVQRDRATTLVDYDAAVKQHKDTIHDQSSPNIRLAVVSETPVAAVNEEPKANAKPDNTSVADSPVVDQPITNQEQLTANPIQALKKKFVASEEQTAKAKVSLADSLEQVAPFEILGVNFKDWVLIADAEALKLPQQLTLWENILSALSISPQVLKFPICPGISDKESANASVAGFVFCLAKRNDVKVGAVTNMPKSLEHPQLTTLPSLADMLKDSELKKQLWQILNQH